MENFTIGSLATLTGLSAKSIRYYEQEKLIPKARRSHSGYRIYDETIIERLRFIQKAKAIGFHLDDIRRILDLTDKGKPCCAKVQEWSTKRLHELDEQIKFISNLRDRLAHYQEEWKSELKRKSKFPESEICELIQGVKLPEVEQ